MNVKSYLKGIGVGMIVASLILIIAGNMNKVSDEDVIARAKELGYVQSTSVSQPEVVDNTSSNTEQNGKDSDRRNICTRPCIFPQGLGYSFS